jgi:hypothetical protein
VLETLRKIGVPTAIATSISLLVVVAPLLFQIDERYAKAEDLKEQIQDLERQNEQLQRELAQLVGFQSAMATFIQEGRLPPARPVYRRFELEAPPEVLPPPPPAASSAPEAETEPLVRSSRPPIVEPPIATAEPAALPPTIERPMNWRELSDGLNKQQQRLAK